MWHCPKCRERLNDDFEVCWSCGTSKDGVEDPDFRKADDPGPPSDVGVEESTAIQEISEKHAGGRKKAQDPALDCPRCRRRLKFVGTKAFHEGTSWGGFFGDLGEFFVNKESFDVYVCQRCGRVEFFVSGIGEEFRPREES